MGHRSGQRQVLTVRLLKRLEVSNSHLGQKALPWSCCKMIHVNKLITRQFSSDEILKFS